MKAPLDTGAGNSECQFCGRHVTRRFARVFGDEDDVAHRCLACDSTFRVQNGSAAGLDAEHPDPAENPNRNRGPRVGAPVRTDGGNR
ncbi:DUF7563 family protein [Halobaculum litoreum]|uniref:DUF7563 family protein n=1 Tax=Halobaculum litoreum TaxID=3031998 RepID=UPI0024C43403